VGQISKKAPKIVTHGNIAITVHDRNTMESQLRGITVWLVTLVT